MKALEITIEFDVGYTAIVPEVKVFSSADSRNFKLADSGEYRCQLMFNPKCCIGVEFLNKDNADNNWLEIKKICIDNIKLEHLIFEGKLYPVYNPVWLATLTQQPPEFYCPGTQMREAGKWILPITVPVFKTVLNQWLNDEQ